MDFTCICEGTEQTKKKVDMERKDSMAGMIQEIAEMAGVSRGTVDRALNNRGRINPEVAVRHYRTFRNLREFWYFQAVRPA